MRTYCASKSCDAKMQIDVSTKYITKIKYSLNYFNIVYHLTWYFFETTLASPEPSQVLEFLIVMDFGLPHQEVSHATATLQYSRKHHQTVSITSVMPAKIDLCVCASQMLWPRYQTCLEAKRLVWVSTLNIWTALFNITDAYNKNYPTSWETECR